MPRFPALRPCWLLCLYLRLQCITSYLKKLKLPVDRLVSDVKGRWWATRGLREGFCPVLVTRSPGGALSRSGVGGGAPAQQGMCRVHRVGVRENDTNHLATAVFSPSWDWGISSRQTRTS